MKHEETERLERSRYQLLVEVDSTKIESFSFIMLCKVAELGCSLRQIELSDLARRIYDFRRRRSEFFENSLFGEPVWDMLLALYAGARPLSVTDLGHAACVPQTTSLRWAQLLQDKGLISREPDRRDARRVEVRLTASGEKLLSNCLLAFHAGVSRVIMNIAPEGASEAKEQKNPPESS